MTVKLYRRGRVWWINFRYEGQRIRRSLETTSARVAKKVREEIEARLALGEPPFGRPCGPTFSEYAEEWLARVGKRLRPSTYKGYVRAVREAQKIIGGKTLSSVTRDDARRVVEAMRQGPRRERTRQTVAVLPPCQS